MIRDSTAVAFTVLLCASLSQEWPAFRHWWVWDAWRRYFRLRVVTPPLPYIDPAKPVLFAHFPHATFPMGSWLSLALCDAPETGGHSFQFPSHNYMRRPISGLTAAVVCT